MVTRYSKLQLLLQQIVEQLNEQAPLASCSASLLGYRYRILYDAFPRSRQPHILSAVLVGGNFIATKTWLAKETALSRPSQRLCVANVDC